MPETKVQPEDIAAAEKIISVYSEGVSGTTWQLEVDACSAIIAASRPPLVARLVAENTRLRKALEHVAQYVMPEDVANVVEVALSPAPVLDLGEVERVIEGRVRQCRSKWGTSTRFPHDEKCDACGDLLAVLATVREVTKC